MGQQLKKAPLREVMIELRWKVDEVATVQSGLFDPGFEAGVGLLWRYLMENGGFVTHTRLRMGERAKVGIVYHQFRTESEQGPVIQLGPGVITVSHSNKDYGWETSFLPLFKSAVLAMQTVYPIEDLIFQRCAIRYTDAVAIADYGYDDPVSFVSDQMRVSVDSQMSRYLLRNFRISQQYLINDSILELIVQTGKEGKKDAIIWHTTCDTNADNLSTETIYLWLDKAHNDLTEFFVELCSKKELYASFS